MNFDEILKKILDIADFPKEKKDEFVRVFYMQIFIESLKEIEAVDAIAGQKIKDAIQNQKNPEELQQMMNEALKNQSIKEKVDEITDEALRQLADDVSKYATDVQKQQILASLPN